MYPPFSFAAVSRRAWAHAPRYQPASARCLSSHMPANERHVSSITFFLSVHYLAVFSFYLTKNFNQTPSSALCIYLNVHFISFFRDSVDNSMLNAMFFATVTYCLLSLVICYSRFFFARRCIVYTSLFIVCVELIKVSLLLLFYRKFIHW